MPYSDASSPQARYSAHKANSKRRGIPFLLTFEQWWEAWAPHWPNRGKGAGKLVMARYGDEGPYASWNVHIITQEHNGSTKRGVRPRTITKLREADIPSIRALICAGFALQKIGKKYGVSRNAIRQIAVGRTWKGV